MLRYMALLWDATDASSTNTAQVMTQRLLTNSGSWHSVLSKTGFSILARQSPFKCYAPHLLGDCGAVLGVVFDRNDATKSSALKPSPFFSDLESEKIVRSGGNHLVENYWGR